MGIPSLFWILLPRETKGSMLQTVIIQPINQSVHQYPEEETMLASKDILCNFTCIDDNKTYQKEKKFIQKIKWGMEHNG